MQFLFDIVLARINFVIVILLIAIYILRKIGHKNSGITGGFIHTLNRLLRQYHKALGALAIILGLFHGFLSSDNILTFNLGTCSWALLILIGASWFFKSSLRRKGWLYYHRILAVLFTLTLFFHVVDVGGFTSDILSMQPEKKPGQAYDTDTSSTNEFPISQAPTKAKYKDGIYTGKATGYRPGLVVQVTIANGVIANITIVSHNEREPKHYGLAMKRVPEEIIKSQSTAVNGVSGATKTSNGIKNAINDALTKAAAP